MKQSKSLENLKKNLINYRQKHNLSRQQLAELTNLSYATIYNIEHSKTSCTLETLDYISKGLNIEPIALIF